VSNQTWWFVSRSSGIVAWALAAFSVLWGMALSTRALGRQPRAPWLLDLHRFLGALTIVFVAVHMLGLFLDQYAHFSVADLLVPFATTGSRPPWPGASSPSTARRRRDCCFSASAQALVRRTCSHVLA
jgi:hypothetical protein